MTFQSFTPLQYLKIDVAGSYGLDKEDWDVRIQWFDDHLTEIEDMLSLMASKPGAVQSHPLLKKADSPSLFFAGVQAWDKARRGEAIAYPISLDATASGAQIMAILVGCEKSAEMCNVVDTGSRQDFYTNIFKGYTQRSPNPGAFTRSDLKDATVPWFYGSEKEPIAVFGEESEDLAVYKQTLEEEAPGVAALRTALVGLWNPDALSHDWVLPDNFHVKVKVMGDATEEISFAGMGFVIKSKVNKPTDWGLSNAANGIHSIDALLVREMGRRCNFSRARMNALHELMVRPTTLRANERSPHHELVKALWAHYQDTNFLSARILEVLDEDNMHLVDKARIIELMMTLPVNPFPILTNHDCFRCHPNYANDLRRQYNQLLFELAESDVLGSLASQIAGTKQTVNRMGHFSKKILEANYALS